MDTNAKIGEKKARKKTKEKEKWISASICQLCRQLLVCRQEAGRPLGGKACLCWAWHPVQRQNAPLALLGWQGVDMATGGRRVRDDFVGGCVTPVLSRVPPCWQPVLHPAPVEVGQGQQLDGLPQLPVLVLVLAGGSRWVLPAHPHFAGTVSPSACRHGQVRASVGSVERSREQGRFCGFYICASSS